LCTRPLAALAKDGTAVNVRITGATKTLLRRTSLLVSGLDSDIALLLRLANAGAMRAPARVGHRYGLDRDVPRSRFHVDSISLLGPPKGKRSERESQFIAGSTTSGLGHFVHEAPVPRIRPPASCPLRWARRRARTDGLSGSGSRRSGSRQAGRRKRARKRFEATHGSLHRTNATPRVP
jgi:hypothetical protein